MHSDQIFERCLVGVCRLSIGDLSQLRTNPVYFKRTTSKLDVDDSSGGVSIHTPKIGHSAEWKACKPSAVLLSWNDDPPLNC